MDLEVFNSEVIFYEDSDPHEAISKTKEEHSSTDLYDPEENALLASKKNPKKTAKKIQKTRKRDRG